MNSLVFFSGIGLLGHAAVLSYFVGGVAQSIESPWQRFTWIFTTVIMWLALFGLARVMTIGLGETL